MEEFPLQLVNWSAWAPTLETKVAWENWAGVPPTMEEPKVPQAKCIPPMQRRRCSRLTKMALQVANEACEELSVDFSLFCSRHGELHRTVKLLEDVVTQNELSPMAFAQSVHNTASGLHGIINQTYIPSTSIAATRDMVEQAWIEAYAFLRLNRDKKVLMIVFDETVPSQYRPYVSHQEDIAFALVLESNPLSITSQTISLIKNSASQVQPTKNNSLSSPWQFMQSMLVGNAEEIDKRWIWQFQ
ncbi:3-oxoacyl-ACP synthase [Corallincola holothuriorum]|uniref:3-oxoacyl-ACP synthase n=1 Tax=Corallincola holothuriorum TaxID=2282215 RepID=A0A368NTF5_9GAMM|nr:beta-ketoacyl synthase chain length factor [Corallincola holothuriorum]RCU52779.1 3-oxoacyl-ACP synthase [Corallincola holothuriorum]